MFYSLGNNTLDCDECISKLDENGFCSCLQNGCNASVASEIIPNECIHHFIASEDVNSECVWKILSNFSHCEPANLGNFHIFGKMLKPEIELNLDLMGNLWNFIA